MTYKEYEIYKKYLLLKDMKNGVQTFILKMNLTI